MNGVGDAIRTGCERVCSAMHASGTGLCAFDEAVKAPYAFVLWLSTFRLNTSSGEAHPNQDAINRQAGEAQHRCLACASVTAAGIAARVNC